MKQKDPQIYVKVSTITISLESVEVTYEEHLRLQVCVSFSFVDHVRCRIRKSEVEQPVGGCCHGQGFGSDLQREQFTSDDPGHRTPRACEEEDVEAYESDGNFLC